MVGIIIPTINRSGFLIRQLAYYADLGSKHPLYIGDSSDSQHAQCTQEAVRKLRNRVPINYFRFPGASDYQTISELVQRVEEPYVAFMGDDDFLVPATLDKCAVFLDENPDYSSAHGSGMLFNIGSDGEYGEFLTTSEIAQPPIEGKTASSRLVDFLRSYWSLPFSVQRTEIYQTAAQEGAMLSDPSFPELLTGCLSVIRGKAKKFDCLYLARQNHPNRFGVYLPDIFEWVTKSDWLSSYERMRDILAGELRRQDNISIETGCEVVKEAFWSYLSQALDRKWHGRYPDSSSRRNGSFRSMVRRSPAALQVWRLLRSRLSPGSRRFSLPALLRRSSPYHDDFMPIYRAVTAPPEPDRKIESVPQ